MYHTKACIPHRQGASLAAFLASAERPLPFEAPGVFGGPEAGAEVATLNHEVKALCDFRLIPIVSSA